MSNSVTSAIQEFVTEADEVLERLTITFTRLEKGIDTEDGIHSVYRDVHSLKGTAHLFGCQHIGTLAHCLEAVMEPLRSGRISLTPSLIDQFYLALDALRVQVNNLRTTGLELPSQANITLIPRLIEIALFLLDPTNHQIEHEKSVFDFNQMPVETLPIRASPSISENQFPDIVLQLNKPHLMPRQTDLSIPNSLLSDESYKATRDSISQHETYSSESIRVSISVLDNLMNLVGELVLIRNQVIQATKAQNVKPEFNNLSQRLSVVTTELQSEVMKTRMQPIDNIVSKFHRVSRDMARELGKSIDLILEGTDTEVDKTLIEAIKDPLTHIVRNAIDHVIESQIERRTAQKPENGRLVIRAFHEGGRVIIEISDDGRGLSRAKIISKALEKGMIAPETAARLSEREIYQLVFTPGFTTTDRVSDLSGRGVGLDVVKNNVERIGGFVELLSTEGKGTTIRLKIPLTLAIIPALIVQAGIDRFAIPQIKLVELLRAERSATNGISGIEKLQGKPVYRLRGNLLPLITLTEMLGIENKIDETDGAANIVVLNTDNGYFGLIVDDIVDSTDIVVKPMTSFLKSLGVFSGSTVLGDGSVILTLDVIGLADRANMFHEDAPSDTVDHSFGISPKTNFEITDYLLIDIGSSCQYAIPLCLINRLEEFHKDSIEISGKQRVIRYRDAILPLLSATDHLNFNQSHEEHNYNDSQNISVIVVERGGRYFGLEVARVLDILSTEAEVDDRIRDRPGIIGSLIYDDAVLVVLDILAIIDQHLGREPASIIPVRPQSKRESHHILIVEDNAFFRRQVATALSRAGFKISTATDGVDGYEQLLSSPSTFAAVISDIEMPRMTGFDLARRVRETDLFASLPMIALTTKFRTSDQEEGQRVGFVRYLEKLNSDQLISALDNVLGIVEGR